MHGRDINCLAIIRDACAIEADRFEHQRDNYQKLRDDWQAKLDVGMPASSECPEVKSDFNLGVYHGNMDGAEEGRRVVERIARLAEALMPYNVK